MPVSQAFQSQTKPGRSYLRAPVPLHFPTDEEVPEGGVHLELRTALYLILRGELAGRAFVGSEQFLYWDPADPNKCLAPDVMVRLQGPDLPLPCLKVWEGGAPQLAVEIVSPSDASDRNWSAKLERYRQSGVAEIVRFDPDDSEQPLRLWDRVEGDLVERVLDGPAAFSCDALGLYWHHRPDQRLGSVLRLARGPEGRHLLVTPEERIAELEAELRRR
jgi:hypothetical protein